MDKTAIVVLNYNGVDHLRKFMPTLVRESSGYQIVVIDNNSTDQSIAFLNGNHPEVQIVKLSQNFGFSGGYNRGLEQVDAENLVLLNSDVEVTEGWVQQMTAYMQMHPEVAVCQPKILSLGQNGRFDYAGAAGGFLDMLGYPFCRGRLFNHLETDHGQYDGNHSIFWAGGACFFIRAGVFRELGGFDEDFFAHMEEIDLCWRCHRAGHKVSFVSNASVYHLGGGTLKDSNPLKTYLNFRNGLQLLLKNSSFLALIWQIPLRILLDIIAAFRFLLQGSTAHSLAVIKAEWNFFLSFYRTWQKRKQLALPFENSLTPILLVWQYFVRGRKTYKELPIVD